MDPVYSAFEESPTVVGFLIVPAPFGNLLNRLLPEGANGLIAVMTDTCGDGMSFEMDGPQSTFLGYEDLHDPAFDEYERSLVMEMYDE
jgi:hypothetical protein